MKSTDDVTLVKNGVHRANELRHFMRIKKSTKRVTASHKGMLLASSNSSLKLQEVEFDFYDATYYFPREDVNTAAIIAPASILIAP